MDVDNKNKGISVLGEGTTVRLDYTTITTEAEYSIIFTWSKRKFCLSLHYNESNCFLFVNCHKNISIQSQRLRSKTISIIFRKNFKKIFAVNNMKKTGLNGYVYKIYTDYNINDISNIINIHKYLMKNYDTKLCLD